MTARTECSPVVDRAQWTKRIKALPNIGRFLRLVSNSGPSLFVSVLALRLLRAVMPVVQFWVPKQIFDQILAILRHGQGNMQTLWELIAIQLLLAVVNEVSGRTATLCESLLGERFTNHVNAQLMQHACTLDLASFENPSLYDKLERARNQTVSRLSLLSSILNVTQEIITLSTLLLGFMFLAHWLIVILVITTFPSFLYDGYFGAERYTLMTRMAPERRNLDYIRSLATNLGTAKEIRLFDLGGHFVSVYRKIAEQVYGALKRHMVRRAVTGIAVNILSILGYYGAYIYALIEVIAGKISLGTFTFFSGSFSRASASIERISGSLNGISDSALFLQDLFDFLALQPLLRSTGNSRHLPKTVKSGLEFRNVSFRYPGTDRLVLRNISFHLPPCTTMALVGENGSGKTSIVKLLSRLYDPIEGKILLDGTDLREYDPLDLHRQIGVIFQDFVRYDMSLRENVGFGELVKLDDDLSIGKAIENSSAGEIMSRLERGIDQMLGRRFEGGIDLSGGEWQRIALARACMRDAQLMILDEPCASLDARAEYQVFQRFQELTRGRMAVIISHRFGTSRIADKIIVLDNGSIEEEGTHSDLIIQGRHYAELYRMQANNYRD